jgi:hypothetical protein
MLLEKPRRDLLARIANEKAPNLRALRISLFTRVYEADRDMLALLAHQ